MNKILVKLYSNLLELECESCFSKNKNCDIILFCISAVISLIETIEKKEENMVERLKNILYLIKKNNLPIKEDLRKEILLRIKEVEK